MAGNSFASWYLNDALYNSIIINAKTGVVYCLPSYTLPKSLLARLQAKGCNMQPLIKIA